MSNKTNRNSPRRFSHLFWAQGAGSDQVLEKIADLFEAVMTVCHFNHVFCFSFIIYKSLTTAASQLYSIWNDLNRHLAAVDRWWSEDKQQCFSLQWGIDLKLFSVDVPAGFSDVQEDWPRWWGALCSLQLCFLVHLWPQEEKQEPIKSLAFLYVLLDLEDEINFNFKNCVCCFLCFYLSFKFISYFTLKILM